MAQIEESEFLKAQQIIEDFNGLPFHLKSFFDEAEILNSAHEINPNIDSVISLNMHLGWEFENEIDTFLQLEDKFCNMVKNWIEVNSKSSDENKLSWVCRALLVLTGTYTKYVFTFHGLYQEEYSKKNELLKSFSAAQKQIQNIPFNAKEFFDFEEKAGVAVMIEKTRTEKQILELVLTKNGYSILYYFLAKELVEQNYRLLGINKTETCRFIGEVFLLFRIIREGVDSDNFGDNLYRNINRFKEERINELAELAKSINKS